MVVAVLVVEKATAGTTIERAPERAESAAYDMLKINPSPTIASIRKLTKPSPEETSAVGTEPSPTSIAA
jgi:hypothetical protein